MSFRLKTILGVAAIEAVLVAILVLGTLDVLRRTAEVVLFDRAIHVGQGLAETFAPLIPGAETGPMAVLARQVLAVGQLRYLQVVDADGVPVAAAGLDAGPRFHQDTTLFDLGDGVLDRIQPVTDGPRRLGEIRFGLVADQLTASMTRARAWAAGASALALVLVVVLSAMLGLYLTRYLAGLRDASIRLALGDMTHRIPVAGSDELADTARAFNAMAGRLQQLHDESAAREARFREYSEAVSDWFWETDRDERYIYVSDSFHKVTGRSADSLLGRRRWDLNSAKMEVDAALWQDHLKDLAGHQPFRDFKYWLEDDSGRPLWVKESGVPRFDAAGEFQGYRGAGSDITAAVDAANRLHLLGRAIDQSPVAVVITDLSRRIQYVNPKFLETTGYARDEVLGQAASLLKSGETDPAVYADMIDTLNRGEEWHGELINRRRDGSRYWDDASIQPIRNLDGRIAHYLGLMVDVTNRKQDQARLDHVLAELRRSNQDLEHFASAASHDLKQPLRQISAFSALIARRLGDGADDDMRQYLHFLTDGAQRMQALVNDLLDYSRLGHGPVSDETVDMGAVVATVSHLLGGAVSEAGAAIVVGELGAAHGDRGQLERLMQNLVGNALKYRSPDRAALIRVTREPGPVFAVSDNGIGIPPDQAERVFLIFHRLHAMPQVDGTGIGLAICRRIVERHGGRIWLESAGIGQGTTFRFTLAPDNREECTENRVIPSHLP